tara:strand:+ start:577 stop:792 length:216 start_codon:yes stop_codon:yes gene_type:complete
MKISPTWYWEFPRFNQIAEDFTKRLSWGESLTLNEFKDYTANLRIILLESTDHAYKKGFESGQKAQIAKME